MNRLSSMNSDEQKTLRIILKSLADANELFESLPEDIKNETLTFHSEGYSINHCVRWGYQAAEELLHYNTNSKLL